MSLEMMVGCMEEIKAEEIERFAKVVKLWCTGLVGWIDIGIASYVEVGFGVDVSQFVYNVCKMGECIGEVCLFACCWQIDCEVYRQLQVWVGKNQWEYTRSWRGVN